MTDRKPVINSRIEITYVFTDFRDYNGSPESLYDAVSGWIDSALCDREARMEEVSWRVLDSVEEGPDE